MRTTLFERFGDKYIPEPNSGCWLWTAAYGRRGYGLIWDGKRLAIAHRVSWEMHRGEIPAGLKVLHKCDVPPCVNPEHLFLGTQKDNVDDMLAKQRGRAKLTLDDVYNIRTDTRLQREIAADYGVQSQQISRIKSRSRWSNAV